MSTVTLDSVWANAQLLSKRDRSILRHRLSKSIASNEDKEVGVDKLAYREPTEGEYMVKESVVRALGECSEADKSGKSLKNAWALLEEMDQW